MELKFQSVFSWNGPVRGAFVCKNGQTMFAPERLQDDPFGPLYCRDDRMYVKDKYYRDKNNRKQILKFPLF